MVSYPPAGTRFGRCYTPCLSRQPVTPFVNPASDGDQDKSYLRWCCACRLHYPARCFMLRVSCFHVLHQDLFNAAPCPAWLSAGMGTSYALSLLRLSHPDRCNRRLTLDRSLPLCGLFEALGPCQGPSLPPTASYFSRAGLLVLNVQDHPGFRLALKGCLFASCIVTVQEVDGLRPRYLISLACLPTPTLRMATQASPAHGPGRFRQPALFSISRRPPLS